MKYSLITLLALGGLPCFAGAQEARVPFSGLAGSWQQESSGSTAGYDFYPDGTYAYAGLFDMSSFGYKVLVYIEGSYAVSGNKVGLFNNKKRYRKYSGETLLEDEWTIEPDEYYFWQVVKGTDSGIPCLYMQLEGDAEGKVGKYCWVEPISQTEAAAQTSDSDPDAIIGDWWHGGSYGDGVSFKFRSDGTFVEAGIFKLYITGKTNMIIIDGSYTVTGNSIRCFNQKMRHQLWKGTTVLLEERQLDDPPDETYLWRIEADPYGGTPSLYMQTEGKEEETRYGWVK